MRWVCSRCGNEVSVALTECPYCAEAEANAPTVVSSPPAVASSVPAPEPAAAGPREAVSSPAPPAPPRMRSPARSAPAKEEPPAESAFLRGVKFGIGFALAVAVILFLFALLQFFLREAGWQPWFENLLG